MRRSIGTSYSQGNRVEKHVNDFAVHLNFVRGGNENDKAGAGNVSDRILGGG